MRILLVYPPPGDLRSKRLAELLELLIRDLCAQNPGYELNTLTGVSLPGRFSFITISRLKKELKSSKPDVVIFCSLSNLLIDKQLRTLVAVTDPLDSIQSKRIISTVKGKKLSGILTDVPAAAGSISQFFPNRDKLIYPIPFVEAIPDQSGSELGQIRDQFTSGREYFYYSGHISDNREWERVLQAFSLFRKWQQSSIQLVLTGTIEFGYEEEFNEKLKAYKHHSEVLFLGSLSRKDKSQVLSAAFMLIANGRYFDERMDIITAFRSGVPAVTDSNLVSAEFGGDATLSADFNDHESISQLMILLYKDEGKYISQVAKGKLKMQQFNYTECLQQLNNCLTGIAAK